MEIKKEKRNLLLVGAYGLVGNAICKILEEKYPDIEVTKIKFDVIYDNEHGLVSSYFYDPMYLKEDSFDFVIHAAGYGQPQMFGRDKVKTIEINTRTTGDLFRAIKKEGKFLFVSTSEVYSGAPSPHTEEMIGTTTPQHPRACYIEGKRCGEAICMAYKEQGYDVKIARLALAYGPGTKKGDTRVLNQFIEQALTTGEIRMKDTGDAVRTYCYVDDAAEMMLDILFKGKDVVYNVGGVSKVSVRDLADYIGAITGAKVILGDMTLEGSPDTVELNINKIQSEFPRQFTEIGVGISRTIKYQKELYGR